MKEPPLKFDAASCECVAAQVRRHCAFRAWTLFAQAVRSTHVHVVVGALVPPEKVMGELKAWCTRALRENGFCASDRRVWSRHGSTRYLWEAPHVIEAMGYVMFGQDDSMGWADRTKRAAYVGEAEREFRTIADRAM